MSDAAVTGDVVALCLSVEELRERGLGGAISDAEARVLVYNELLLAGREPWLEMEVELFLSCNSLLLVARPIAGETHCFVF